MATVNLDELEIAMTMVGEMPWENEAWVSRETGIVHIRSDEYMDDEAPLPANVEDDGLYVPVPGLKSLDLGKALVFRFAEARMPGDVYRIEEFFRKKGAYSRFSNLVERRGGRDAWHRFRADETRAALRAWCEENGLQPGA